ncbi:hypothetical protein UFOVP112_113 [uncultured Caudovirales phage]|uniref:Uncharacterized protein n=1 Tax=uncultured Caudovirales phage TaxID=2100421 RepID=A0A6J5L5W8_9CAUD|nr:hypothetical protein UFOVP112_113 [uncultured Caudovirales phage]
MAYSQGGLIAAADYNNFINGSNQLNTVWNVGTGNAGYGQTAISAVSQSGTVTATQWATLINTLNSTLVHQSGTGSGISATTAGTTINYLSTLSTNVNTAYTNRVNFATQGTTTTGTATNSNFTCVNTTAAQTFTVSRTATFASADQARYFFNAGGQLNFVCGTATNGGATNRGADLVTLVNTNFISYPAFRQGSGGGRSGTGGTVVTNVTNIGYYQLTTLDQTLVKITSTTSPYTGDYIQLVVKSNGTIGANGDKGTVITYTLTLYSDVQSTYSTPPAAGPGGVAPVTNTTTEDSINITVPNRIDIVYPETTNLTNSWGTVTIA